MKRFILALSAVVLLSGCAGGAPVSEGTTEPSENSGMIAVTITTSSDDHQVVASRNVVCSTGQASGSHPEPQKACDVLRQVDLEVFEPVPADTACTMQYGGPEKGEIRGKIGCQEVDAEFSKTNGCEISRWEALEGVWHDPLG